MAFNRKAQDDRIVCKPAEPEAVIVKDSELQIRTVAMRKHGKRSDSAGVSVARPQSAKIMNSEKIGKTVKGLEAEQERIVKKQLFVQKVQEMNKNKAQSSSKKQQTFNSPSNPDLSSKPINSNPDLTVKIDSSPIKTNQKTLKPSSSTPQSKPPKPSPEEQQERLKKLKILVQENIKKHKEINSKKLSETDQVSQKSRQEIIEKITQEAKEIIKKTQLVEYKPTGKWGVDERNFIEKPENPQELEAQKIRKISEENKKIYREKVKNEGRARIGLEIIDFYPNLLENKRREKSLQEANEKQETQKNPNPQVQQWMKVKKLKEKEKKALIEQMEQEKIRKKIQCLKELEALSKPTKMTKPPTPIQELKEKINKKVSSFAKKPSRSDHSSKISKSNSSINYIVDSEQFNLSPLNKEKIEMTEKNTKKNKLRVESFESREFDRSEQEISNYSQDFESENNESEKITKKVERVPAKGDKGIDRLEEKNRIVAKAMGQNGKAGFAGKDGKSNGKNIRGIEISGDSSELYEGEIDSQEEMEHEMDYESGDEEGEEENSQYEDEEYDEEEEEEFEDEEYEGQQYYEEDQHSSEYSSTQEKNHPHPKSNPKNLQLDNSEASSPNDQEYESDDPSEADYNSSAEFQVPPAKKSIQPKPVQASTSKPSNPSKPSKPQQIPQVTTKKSPNPGQIPPPNQNNPQALPGNSQTQPGFARFLLHPKSDPSYNQAIASFADFHQPPQLNFLPEPDPKEKMRTRLAEIEKKVEKEIKQSKEQMKKQEAKSLAVVEDDLEVKFFKIPGVTNMQEAHELRRVYDQVHVYQAASKIQAAVRGYIVRKDLFRKKLNIPTNQQMKSDIHQILLKYYPEAYVPENFASGSIPESMSFVRSQNYLTVKEVKEKSTDTAEIGQLNTFIHPVFKENDEFNLIKVLVKEFFVIESEASASVSGQGKSVKSSEVYSEEFESESEDIGDIYNRAKLITGQKALVGKNAGKRDSIEESIEGYSEKSPNMYDSIKESFEHSAYPTKSKSSSIKESIQASHKSLKSSNSSIQESIEYKSKKFDSPDKYSIQESIDSKSKKFDSSEKYSIQESYEDSTSKFSSSIKESIDYSKAKNKSTLSKNSSDSIKESFRFQKITDSIPEVLEEHFHGKASDSSSLSKSIEESFKHTEEFSDSKSSKPSSSRVSESIPESMSQKDSSYNLSSRKPKKLTDSSDKSFNFNKTNSSRKPQSSSSKYSEVYESYENDEDYDEDFESLSSANNTKKLREVSSKLSDSGSGKVPKLPLKLKSSDPEIRFSQHQSSEFTESINDDIDESIHYTEDFESLTSERKPGQVSGKVQEIVKENKKNNESLKETPRISSSEQSSSRLSREVKSQSSEYTDEIEESIKSSINSETSLKKPSLFNDSGKQVKILESIGESIKYSDDFESSESNSLAQKTSNKIEDNEKSSKFSNQSKNGKIGKHSDRSNSSESEKSSEQSKYFNSYSDDFESLSQSGMKMISGIKHPIKEETSEDNISVDIKESIYSEESKKSEHTEKSLSEKQETEKKNVSAIYVDDDMSEDKESRVLESYRSDFIGDSMGESEQVDKDYGHIEPETIPKLLLPNKPSDPEARFSQHKSSDFSESMNEDIAESIYSDDFESERSDKKSMNQSQRSKSSSYRQNPSNFNTKFPTETLSPSSPAKVSGRSTRKSPELRSSTSSISEDFDMYDSFSKQSVNLESSLRRSASLQDSSKLSKGQESIDESIKYSEDFESDSRSYKPGHSYSSDFDSISHSESRGLKGLRVPIKEESPEESSSQEITDSARGPEEVKYPEVHPVHPVESNEEIVDEYVEFIFDIIKEDAISIIYGREVNDTVDFLYRLIIDDCLKLVPSKKIYVNNSEYLEKTLERVAKSIPSAVKVPEAIAILNSYFGSDIKLENYDLNSSVSVQVPNDHMPGFRSMHKAIRDSINFVIQDFELSVFKPVKAKTNNCEVKGKISKWINTKLGSTKSCMSQEEKKNLTKQNETCIKEVVNEELEEENFNWMNNEKVEVCMIFEIGEWIFDVLAGEIMQVLGNNY